MRADEGENRTRVVTFNHYQPVGPGKRHASHAALRRRPTALLPHEWLCELPATRSRDAGGHLPRLRLPPPGDLTDQSDQPGVDAVRHADRSTHPLAYRGIIAMRPTQDRRPGGLTPWR